MKRTRVLFLSIFFLVSVSVGVMAADEIKKVEAYLRSDFQLFLDGEKVDTDAILIYQDRSYLPLAEIGEMVGVDVNWKSENKGIYINRRYPGQPDQGSDEDLTYDEMGLYVPGVMNVSYLGGKYSILTNTDYDYNIYYRVKDLNILGMDTRGLRKALEPFTNHLYVDKAELAGLWKEEPVQQYDYEYIIAGENDEEQLKAVEDFIESIPIKEAILRGEEINGLTDYYEPPLLLSVDVLPNDEYAILTDSSGVISLYSLELKRNSEGDWYTSGYTKKIHEFEY